MSTIGDVLSRLLDVLVIIAFIVVFFTIGGAIRRSGVRFRRWLRRGKQ